MKNLLIYGANGYMGRMVALEAKKNGLNAILAGRTTMAKGVAIVLGLPYKIFSLENPSEIQKNLKDVAVVLNLAGAFSQTAKILAQACILAKVHYLDIAGEVPEFEAVHSLSEQAQNANVMLMSGVGFGVVPTDCLALHLKKRLPDAQKLTLAFATEGGVSKGTLKTVLKDIHRQGVRRKEGKFVAAMPAEKSLEISVKNKKITVVSNPWRADLFTAFLTTNIPNIETYSTFPPPLVFLMKKGLAWKNFLDGNFFQGLLKKLINLAPEGPSKKELATGKTFVWGKVENAKESKISMFEAQEAYVSTAMSAILIAKQVLEGNFKAGFQTPAQIYGVELLEQMQIKMIDL